MVVKQLELELTSKCNLKCPFCAHSIMKFKPKDLDLKVFNKIDMKQLTDVDICGVCGEPVCHSDFLSFIDMIHDKATVVIHTNGSVRKEKWWAELAKRVSKNKNSKVIFALDGLEESHVKYRVGSNYKQLLKNIEAYTTAGGRAEAQFILFDYNHKEIDDVKALTIDLGCERLLLRTSCAYDHTFKRPYQLQTRKEICAESKQEVVCKHLERSTIFIDFEGDVFPCCFVDICKHDGSKDKQIATRYKKYSSYINLNDNNLDQILNSEFFKFLYVNYQDIELCNRFCRTNRDSIQKEA